MLEVGARGGLPIRQNRQLPKARHDAEARNFIVNFKKNSV